MPDEFIGTSAGHCVSAILLDTDDARGKGIIGQSKLWQHVAKNEEYKTDPLQANSHCRPLKACIQSRDDIHGKRNEKIDFDKGFVPGFPLVFLFHGLSAFHE